MSNFPSSSQALSAQGSQLKDIELVRWLENKLNDRPTWNGRANAALLSKTILEELETCFQSLDVQSKLKLLLALSHINPRLMAMWKDQAHVLLGICRRDPDDWVETIAELYRELPHTGVVLTNTSSKESHYAKNVELLRKEMHTILGEGSSQILPEGYAIASGTVIKDQFGEQTETNRHFNLRKKPKSFSLMKEIEKQCENQIALREQKGTNVMGSTVPIKFRSTLRKANNDLPMKGIPTQNSLKLNSGFTAEPKKFQRTLVKREGGAKLLDIAEIPQSLKKRKVVEATEEKRRKQEEKDHIKQRAAEEKKLMTERKKQEVPKPQEPVPAQKPADEDPKLPIKPEPKEALTKEPQPPAQKSPIKSPPPVRPAPKLFNTDLDMPILTSHPNVKKEVVQPEAKTNDQPPVQLPQTAAPAPYLATIPAEAFRNPISASTSLSQSNFLRQQQPTHPPPVSHATSHSTSLLQQSLASSFMAPSIQLVPMSSLQQRNQPSQSQVQQQQQQPPSLHSALSRPSPVVNLQPTRPSNIPAYAANTPQLANRTLQDEIREREAMITKQCNDMLGSANVLDAAGRQMILSFMSGNKNNPRPELGNQLTLKLSESLEDVYVDNRISKMKIETFFQMDYSSGEWKRLRKSRILQPHEVTPDPPPQMTPIQLSLAPGTSNQSLGMSGAGGSQQQQPPAYLYLQQFNQKPFNQY